VSKFFKALENAERERQNAKVTEAAAPAAPPEPAAAVPAAEVAPAAEPPRPAPEPAVSRPFRRAAPREEPVATPLAEPVVAAAAPALDAPPAPQAVDAPPPRTPAYGAPIARAAAAAHGRAFDAVLPPPPIDEPGEVDDHLVSLLEPTSPAAEQYRTIRLHIETLHRERGLAVVAVSSPARGDGKTISAINLAGALAQAPDARVALLEADVRHPGVGRYLGLSRHRGLSTYLLDHSMDVDAVIERPAGAGFAVIVAGPASSMPYELLKSPRLRALVGALRARFDFVVVDTPPVLPFPDVGILRDLVDGFLLVVRANRTPREMVRDSLGALGQDRVLGVVFNEDERAAATAPRDDAGDGWRARLSRPLGGSRAA